MADRIQPRRDTAARWAAANPVLLEGEWGIVTDSPSQYKIGDGVTPWNSLPLRGYDGNLLQTTGNETKSVMSQDATTKALAAQKNYTDTKAKEVADNLSASEQRIEGEIGELRQEAADTYATKTGEYKELTAGFAYEILGDGQATSEKFSFRPTGGPNRNVRDGSARIEVLKGNSVVWNQLVNASTIYASTSNGIEFTVANGKVIANGTATANASLGIRWNSTQGHIYAMVGCPSGGSESTHKFYNQATKADYGSGVIYTETRSGAIYNVIQIKNGVTADNLTFTPRIYDLTQMFGEEIANTINTVEQFYELLPEGVDINAYNEGEIVDANYKAIKTTGFNQWNEQWEKGVYHIWSGGSGIKLDTGYENYIRNKNYIKVFPNTTYCVLNPNGVYVTVGAFNSNNEFIGQISYKKNTSTYGIFDTPSDCSKIVFYMKNTTYNNDICINIAWDEYSALNGTYKPYKPFERDLSWLAKYFPNGRMRRAGNVADEVRFNSTTQQWEAVQRVGVVDLGSLMWTAFSDIGAGWFYSPVFASLGGVNIISEKYSVTTKLYGQMPNKTMNVIGSASAFLFCIHDSTYTDASTFKAAMQGVMLNYELATPIVTPITEDVNLAYDVADYGTEQLIVAEGAQSAPLSAEVVYEPNVLASIKQVAAMLTRLDALETAVATMQASAVATTNEE